MEEDPELSILSFDIEISEVFDLRPGEDIEKYAPFHISVAATAIYGGEERLWYSEDHNGTPSIFMTRRKALELLEYLSEMQKKGVMICAWNGLKFDLHWIGYNADNLTLAAEIALGIYDPMFQFFNSKGFPISLAAVADAMNIPQVKSMNASDAPKTWKAGEYQKVMDYVLGDCQMTNRVINEIMKEKAVYWITKGGQRSGTPMHQLKTVKAILSEPGPNQSWMDSPLPRKRFYNWFPSTF